MKKTHIIILVLMLCIVASGCESTTPVVINGQINNTTDVIKINSDNVTIDSANITQITLNTSNDDDNSLFYVDQYTITGKLVNIILSGSNPSTFVFSDGTIINVKYAQQHPWKINKTYKIETYKCNEGYAILDVQQLD